MKRIIFSLIVAVGLFTGCSEDQSKKQDAETVVGIESAPRAFVANTEESIAIEGMTCMINCVSTVKKALKNTDGITDVQVDFDPDRSVDVATVKFDNSEVDRQNIIDIIEELNGGTYKVVDSIDNERSSGIPSSENSSNTDNSIFKKISSVVSTKIEIPSVF